MSFLLFLIKSWLIGVAVAAVIGPISMLFIRKTLENGVQGAVAVGLGAAVADGVYGVIAALGMSAISHFLLEKAVFIKIAGGLFLLYLAYQDLKTTPSAEATVITKSKTTLRLAIEVFFLTLASPVTIVSFIGIFSVIGGGLASTLESLVMAFGIFLGSVAWWVVLGAIILKIKHKLPAIWVHRIKYWSALAIGGFGVYAVCSGLVS